MPLDTILRETENKLEKQKPKSYDRASMSPKNKFIFAISNERTLVKGV